MAVPEMVVMLVRGMVFVGTTIRAEEAHPGPINKY